MHPTVHVDCKVEYYIYEVISTSFGAICPDHLLDFNCSTEAAIRSSVNRVGDSEKGIVSLETDDKHSFTSIYYP